MSAEALLPSGPLLAAFLTASVLLAVTPGPGVLYIVARCLSQGRASGLACAAGVAAGNFCNALASALGLAGVLTASSTAFAVLKWAGAAYLIGLGLQALRAAPAVGPTLLATVPLRRVARDGFVVALLNPKTALFFAAFLPQFIQPQAPVVAQSMVLGTVFVAIAATTDGAYVLLAARVAPLWADRSPRWGRWFSGGTYIGLGVLTALTEQRAPTR
jgi:threonine/homoserine/homoserine lactone efflux protein